jgi:hypothetical protein
MADHTLWMLAGVIVLLQTLDTLRRYFTAKRRWPLSTLLLQLALLPAITVGGLIFILKVALPLFVKPISG